MKSFSYICRDCSYILVESGAISECPVCGGNHISVCIETDPSEADSLFVESVKDFNEALDKENFLKAKQLIEEVAVFGADAAIKLQVLLENRENIFIHKNEPVFQGLCNNERFDEARVLLGKWKTAGVSIERFEQFLASSEQSVFLRIFNRLPAVSGLLAIPSNSGPAQVDLSWDDVLQKREGKYRIARKTGYGPILSFPVEDYLVETKTSVFKDESVPLGVPIAYAIVACFKGRINERTMGVVHDVVCTAPVENFCKRDAAGSDTCGVASLSWTNPPWDLGAAVEMQIVREDGKSWNVSGQNSFEDDSVRAGEVHRYRMEVTVAGKPLKPLECEVVVEAVPAPPPIEGAFAFIQDGRPRLVIPQWPEGVPGVLVSRSGLRPRYLSQDEYNAKRFFFHSEDEVDTATLQAVRRFVPGPASRISRATERQILSVSIGNRLWKRSEYGMKVLGRGAFPLPPIVVSIESPRGQVRSFDIPTGGIAAGVFFPFPAEWGTKRGESIEVFVPEGYSVRYLTSKKLS